MNKLDFLLLNSDGRFVSVLFVKKDGTLRKLTGRLGVTKHLKGGQSTLNPDQYVTIYDVENKGYRAVNRNTIQELHIDGLVVKLAEA
jgi:hypothetical protein